MKIYIGGRISGNPNYKEQFAKAAARLEAQGHIVLNPTILSHIGLEHHEYMYITYAMITVSEKVYFLKDWKDSQGARAEKVYAESLGKEIEFE